MSFFVQLSEKNIAANIKTHFIKRNQMIKVPASIRKEDDIDHGNQYYCYKRGKVARMARKIEVCSYVNN